MQFFSVHNRLIQHLPFTSSVKSRAPLQLAAGEWLDSDPFLALLIERYFYIHIQMREKIQNKKMQRAQSKDSHSNWEHSRIVVP